MIDKIAKYPFNKRIGYATRNNYFLKKKFWFFTLSWMPSNFDIHIHNIWKDTKK